MNSQVCKYGTPSARWTGVGPYYAMFPAIFCDKVVRRFTEPDDLILDPFGGRGTAVFSAASLGRRALGVELNPVGWIYGKTKLSPAPEAAVVARLMRLAKLAQRYSVEAESLPRFFSRCFHRQVRQFLIAAKYELDWRADSVDRTLMSLILVNLHGKRHDSLSNQMRQTKAMAPKYAIRWWKEHDLSPPKIDPVLFLRKKISWRYCKGVPVCKGSEFLLGDSTEVLARIAGASSGRWKGVKLLLTSPPYFGITNYHYDQWLRLWMLGGQPRDAVVPGQYSGKFYNRGEYETLLKDVFGASAKLMSEDSTVYVRTDRREPTHSLTVAALRSSFPGHKLSRRASPYKTSTQTALFGHFAPKFGEVDLILKPS